MSARPVSSLNLRPSTRTKLHKAGFQTVKDLQETTPIELSKEVGISNNEALNILQQIKKSKITSISASEALQQERKLCPISTSCEAMDQMLGGRGVPIGKITEFCGAPGMGKTQLGMQLCVNVQIPQCLSGPEGEAIFIDTEGSFIAQRAAEISKATVTKVNESTGRDPLMNFETVMSKIYVSKVHNCDELIALIKILDEFLQEHPRVKLLVIDSIAFHFRQQFDNMALRTRLLNGLAQDLNKFAQSYELAVVIFNQMTTKFKISGRYNLKDQAALVPALGESWSHQCTNRVVLYWRNEIRCAQLVKSPSLQETTVHYQINSNGIRDYQADSISGKRRWEEDIYDT
ncbi:RAD51-like protein c-like protein [Glomus cerebriforme]|uniref:DNA repair protein RAD51 homolog 3 n=1 Tax=Glomus cerebriforme TaxID=658196 RepID=A0A397TQJ0_9GLOM|nr:RAD51-like protein c-like protein [Glomus cerebriforme]